MISRVNSMSRNVMFANHWSPCPSLGYTNNNVLELRERVSTLETGLKDLKDTVELLSKPKTFGPC